MNLRAGINLKKELNKLKRYNRVPANNRNLTYQNFKSEHCTEFNPLKKFCWLKNHLKQNGTDESLNNHMKNVICTSIGIASAAVVVGFALGKYSSKKSKLDLLRELIYS